MPNAKGGRPRRAVDVIDLIGRRWSGQSWPRIARETHLGRGTAYRAYQAAMDALRPSQNPEAAKVRANLP